MVLRAYLVCSLIYYPKIAPLPFPNNDLLEARELLDLAPPLDCAALSLLSTLLGSYEIDLAPSKPGFFMILPGYGMDELGVRFIELPRLVALSTPETPLSTASLPLFQLFGMELSLS